VLRFSTCSHRTDPQRASLQTIPLLLCAYLLLWERDADRIENTGSRVVTLLFPSNSCFCSPSADIPHFTFPPFGMCVKNIR
jgi:hypothetical protein